MVSIPFYDAWAEAAQPDLLRERIGEDGYLYLPRLIPQAAVREVHRDILAICREHGWADDRGLAVGGPRLEGSPEWFEVYDLLQCLESFHALAHRGEVTSVIEALVEETVLVHPRNIARITFPGAEHFTTPAHQDYVHIQGTHDTYTAWIPLCDCPVEVGGLAILAGSHRLAVLPVHGASGPGGVAVDTGDLGLTWCAQDMRAGDVLLFHSHTVHRALPNLSVRGLRVSMDARYQGVSQPVVADSLEPHYGRVTWEQVYAGWKRADLQYYWRSMPLNIVPREPVEVAPYRSTITFCRCER